MEVSKAPRLPTAVTDRHGNISERGCGEQDKAVADLGGSSGFWLLWQAGCSPLLPCLSGITVGSLDPELTPTAIAFPGSWVEVSKAPRLLTVVAGRHGKSGGRICGKQGKAGVGFEDAQACDCCGNSAAHLSCRGLSGTTGKSLSHS